MSLVLSACSIELRSTGAFDEDDENNYIEELVFWSGALNAVALTDYQYLSITNFSGSQINEVWLAFRLDGTAHVRIAYPKKQDVILETLVPASMAWYSLTNFTPFTYYSTNDIFVTVREENATGRVMLDVSW